MAVVREICSHVAILYQGELVETGEVEEIFDHPKTRAARELLANDSASDVWPGESRLLEQLHEDRRIRIVFSRNSSFEPVIANTILKFGEPLNILKADTRNIGGIAKGEMILGLPKDPEVQEEMIAYFKEVGLEIEEVTEDVE
jgi:D-methionine transport system ATP-binding protein